MPQRTFICHFLSGRQSDSLKQLDWPVTIFIHKQTNSLYITDSDNEHIQMFKLNEWSALGEIVVLHVSNLTVVYAGNDDDEPTI